MIRSFKVRLYPTKEQEELMWKHVNCSRFIWNYMLALQNERYKNGEKYLSRFDMMKLITPLKKQDTYKWLNEVSNASLQICCTDLHKSFKMMFDKISKHPRFKSKKYAKSSYPVSSENKRFYFIDNNVNIEKLGKVKYKSTYIFPKGRGVGKYSNARISYTNGKWILSFGIECESQALNLNGRIGIDLGVKELAVVSHNGQQMIFHNINKSKRVRTLKHKLVHLQRKVARKYRTNGSYEKSNAIIKAEQQAKKIYYHISKIRENYIHQTTHQLVSLNPEVIIIEDLNVSGMMKNKHLSRAISEQCFFEFRRQMEYKCEDRGIKLQFADRFYPSSKTCSCCGSVKNNLKLSDRTYVCDECGLVIDRDFNAALNLERYVG